MRFSRCFPRLSESARDTVAFLRFFFSPGAVIALVICEVVFWTSPQWAQTIKFPTYEATKAAEMAHCRELVAHSCVTEVVHDGGVPIPPEALPAWTLMRVETRFASGLTVVSALGPHADFQYVVRDLALPRGATFRVFRGAVIVN